MPRRTGSATFGTMALLGAVALSAAGAAGAAPAGAMLPPPAAPNAAARQAMLDFMREGPPGTYAGLTERQHPDGSVSVLLDERFLEVVMLRPTAAGRWAVSCMPAAQAHAVVLGLWPAAVATPAGGSHAGDACDPADPSTWPTE